MFVSHAQNFEDVMLWRALRDVRQGFYIDVGANHPEIDSVTMAFYERGWRGIHVEPVPEMARLLREARPEDTVIEAALTADGADVEITDFPGTGLATGIDTFAAAHQASGLPAVSLSAKGSTLHEVFEAADGRDIHFLKIDVEGMEGAVLKGWGDHPARPAILVIESTIPNKPISRHAHWEELVLGRGYVFVYFDGLNRFYLSEENAHRAEFFHVGPNYFDDFSLSDHSLFVRHTRKRLDEQWQRADQAETRMQTAQASLQKLSDGISAAVTAVAAKAKDAAEAAEAGYEKRLNEALALSERGRVEALREQSEAFSAREAALSAQVAEVEAQLARERDAHARASAKLAADHAEKIEQLTTQRSLAEARVAKAAAQLADMEAGYARLERSLGARADAIERIGRDMSELRARLDTSLAERDQARAQLGEAGRTLERLEGDLIASRSRAEAAFARLAEADGRAAALSQSLATAQAGESAALQALGATRRSASWRVTAPVRAAGMMARGAAIGGKSAARSVAAGGLMVVRRLPWLKPLILVPAGLFPPLKRKLERFAVVRLVAAPVVSHSGQNALPPTAVQQGPVRNVTDGRTREGREMLRAIARLSGDACSVPDAEVDAKPAGAAGEASTAPSRPIPTRLQDIVYHIEAG